MNIGTVEELTIPAAVGAADASDFVESTAIASAVEVDTYGTTEVAITPHEILPTFLNQQYEPRRLFVIRRDRRMVARGVYQSVAGETEVAWIDVRVLPEHRGRGFGSTMIEHLERLGRQQARVRLLTYAGSRDRRGSDQRSISDQRSTTNRVHAPTGFGSLPAENPEVRFLLHRSWTLEQVVRGSRLVLPMADLPARLAAATGRSGQRFSLHHWGGHTPERWLADLANLYTRMSIEEPSAGLDEPVNRWSADRVRDAEANEVSGSNARLLVAVEDLGTGHLVGHSELSVPADLSLPVRQGDTLVLPEARGHGLGLLLKLANLDALQRAHPGHPAIHTFNAEENRPMLDVNDAVGFVALGYEGAWKKVLA